VTLSDGLSEDEHKDAPFRATWETERPLEGNMAVSINLSDRVAIVTGGSSGMGKACALRLAEAGAAVVVGGRDSERTDATVSDILAADGRAISSVGDVADPAYATSTVKRTFSEFGRLDILVNGAGVNHRRTAEDTTDEDWRRIMATNVDGVFYMSRAAIPRCAIPAKRRSSTSAPTSAWLLAPEWRPM
jgi:NAD(P)-dependent dehydrogenase (short-subunit alcohol dehydrogenase family)